MKTLYPSLLGFIGALALAGAAFAQVPASNDTSDDNTASGDSALFSNTTGSFATASGYSATGFEALYSNNGGSRGYNCAVERGYNCAGEPNFDIKP